MQTFLHPKPILMICYELTNQYQGPLNKANPPTELWKMLKNITFPIIIDHHIFKWKYWIVGWSDVWKKTCAVNFCGGVKCKMEVKIV